MATTAAQRRRPTAAPPRGRLALLGLAACLLSAQPAAAASVQAPPGTDAALVELETETLGAAHAAEHERARRAELEAQTVADSVSAASHVAIGPAAEVGAWDPAVRRITKRSGGGGMPAVHAALLPTGKVLWYGYRLQGGERYRTEGFAILWDPVTHTLEDVPPPVNPTTGTRTPIYCGGMSLLADGRLLVTGGYLAYEPDATTGRAITKGLDQVWTFDPRDKSWQRHEDLNRGRWYPSQMLMPDGRTFIVQGLTETGLDYNRELEVFDPAKPRGNEVDRLGRSLSSGEDGEFYPHTFWMPTGRGLVAGPNQENSWFFRLSGLSLSLEQADDPIRQRTWGNGVLLPLNHDSTSGSVMQLGGSRNSDPADAGQRDPATSTTERFSESANAWTASSSLNVARAHSNTVLLPDGKMVVVGGGTGTSSYASGADHRHVEVYDPGSGRWRLGPAQAQGRAYHSSAILLPDGSVVSAGDDRISDGDVDTYEIYKPSYFYRGERPVLSSAPTSTGFGRRIWVATPDTDIAYAMLMAPGTTTHATDMNQRAIRLPVTRRGDRVGYDIGTPLNANVAVPGQYMLFLVDDQGRPSHARWVRVDPGAPAQAPPTAADVPHRAPDAIAADARAPRTGARLRTSTIRAARRERGIRLLVRLDEPGTVFARAALGRASGRSAIARWRRSARFATPGTHTIRLPLSRSQRARLGRRGRLVLTVRLTGIDGAGNRARETLRLTLRR